MQLILLCKDRGHLGQLRLTSKRVWLAVASMTFALGAGAFYGGLRTASVFGVSDPAAQVADWRADLESQQALLDQTRRGLQQNIDALALRLGQMNAHVVRLDALGTRLTQMAGLNDGEFDFTTPPALGGPEELLGAEALTGEGDLLQLGGVMSSIDALADQLADRGRQLSVLEDFLLNRKLHDEVHPEGKPVAAGYISSPFGQRSDPFTGRRAFHKGIDFAGRAGTEVIAVGTGVVVWSGKRQGYGELVEVNHGSGYVTRYAHNADNLVSVGDTVKRGQVIARMGDTGRATGPNLHFEVLHNGRAVDPLTFVR